MSSREFTPIVGPVEVIEYAIKLIAFVLQLENAATKGTLSPEVLDEELRIQTPAGVPLMFRYPHTQDGLRDWCRNLCLASVAISSQAICSAFKDLFDTESPPQKPPTEMTSFEIAWVIIYMIRCAFAHNPFDPKWQCTPRYCMVFRLPELGIAADFGVLNGQQIAGADFGGLSGYLRLLQLCKSHVLKLS